MCLRSPWRQVVLAEIRQVAEAVDPDGFWFDLLGAPNADGVGSYDPADACFCPHCREAYRNAYGVEQVASSTDPEIRLRANRFGHLARIAMLREAVDLLVSIHPKMVLGYNGAGFTDHLNGTPRDLQDRVGLHSSEAKSHRLISFKAKSIWALGKPYQVHTYGGCMRMQPGNAVGT
jgi:ribosomal protein S15P/S13E